MKQWLARRRFNFIDGMGICAITNGLRHFQAGDWTMVFISVVFILLLVGISIWIEDSVRRDYERGLHRRLG